MRVYIAGPYTKGDVAINVANAMNAAHALMDEGHAPFVPHLTHFLHVHHSRPYEDWMRLDMAYLGACHALIRLPGESSGADREVDAAINIFCIPVFYSVDDFLNSKFGTDISK